jgi:NAD(P)H-binding
VGAMNRIFYSFVQILLLLRILTVTESLSTRAPVKVVVTGASTSVGYLVFKKLLRSKNFFTIGLVRDRIGFNELKKLGVGDDQIRIGDITNRDTLTGIFDEASKVIMCTSARPKKKFWFRIMNFFLRLIGRERIPQAADLYYPRNQCPYYVDFIGQKNVIDLCLDAKVEHIVMLGNMGGYRGSKLNAIGREEGDTSPKKGNLLKWKRAAERYLMKRCFFTIVHSGALIDEKGGKREIVWDTDDALLRTNFRKIPREDVAEVLVQALVCKDAIGKSAERISSLEPEQHTLDRYKLFTIM